MYETAPHSIWRKGGEEGFSLRGGEGTPSTYSPFSPSEKGEAPTIFAAGMKEEEGGIAALLSQ